MITAGESSIPIFNVPILGGMLRGIVSVITDWVYSNIRLFTDLTFIKLINPVHQAEYEKASENLLIVAHDKGIDSPEYQEAKTDAKTALSAFTMVSQ